MFKVGYYFLNFSYYSSMYNYNIIKKNLGIFLEDKFNYLSFYF